MAARIPGQRSLAPLQSGDIPPSAPELNAHGEKRKRVACKECRQAKLRCDGPLNESGPCGRCRRLSLECQVEVGFKRVNKRQKIDELAEEVERLRSVMGRNEIPPNLSPAEPINSVSNPLPSPPKNPHRRQSTSLQASPQSTIYNDQRTFQEPVVYPDHVENRRYDPHQDQESSLSFQGEVSTLLSARNSQSLEQIRLNSEDITQLFHTFFEYYHPFLDILDPTASPDTYYSGSPLLFWAIISIAARHFGRDLTLLAKLNPCVTKLLWATLSVSPHNRFTIQSMLLLSMWPFPTPSMSTDTSFMLVSMAKTATMHVGLHRPEIVQDFLRVKTQLGPQEFQDAVKVWAGCYIAAQSVTGAIGQPSPLSSDWAIDRACEPGDRYALPTNLRHHLIIYKFIARVNGAMSDHDGRPAGQPTENERSVIMAVLEQDLVDLERKLELGLSATQEILLTMASLQLRTYYFFMTSTSDIRKQGLLRAYTTALTLISKVSDADASWNFVKYCPNGFTQMITMSGMLIMKIINSSYSKYVDTETGIRAFDSVLVMLNKSSVGYMDIRGRANKILTQLWGVHRDFKTRREEEPGLKIKSRLGASLLHDELWMWREQFAGQRGAAQSSTAPATNQKVALSSDARSIAAANQIQKRPSVQATNPAPPTSNFNDTDFSLAFEDNDWMWDIGFPSLLPIDIDSYSTTLSTF